MPRRCTSIYASASVRSFVRGQFPRVRLSTPRYGGWRYPSMTTSCPRATSKVCTKAHRVERARDFYRAGLGLESPGVIGTEFPGDDANPNGAVAMFQLHGGLILALWPRTELAKDANVEFGPAKSGEFSIGHAVASRAAVDAL